MSNQADQTMMDVGEWVMESSHGLSNVETLEMFTQTKMLDVTRPIQYTPQQTDYKMFGGNVPMFDEWIQTEATFAEAEVETEL